MRMRAVKQARRVGRGRRNTEVYFVSTTVEFVNFAVKNVLFKVLTAHQKLSRVNQAPTSPSTTNSHHIAALPLNQDIKARSKTRHSPSNIPDPNHHVPPGLHAFRPAFVSYLGTEIRL
jgi:hypothetical protein